MEPGDMSNEVGRVKRRVTRAEESGFADTGIRGEDYNSNVSLGAMETRRVAGGPG